MPSSYHSTIDKGGIVNIHLKMNGRTIDLRKEKIGIQRDNAANIRKPTNVRLHKAGNAFPEYFPLFYIS